MEITNNQTEYRVGEYRIEVEKDFENIKSALTVWDKNNNVLMTWDSVNEAKAQCEAVLTVINSINKYENQKNV